jgi:hypothetical protein
LKTFSRYISIDPIKIIECGNYNPRAGRKEARIFGRSQELSHFRLLGAGLDGDTSQCERIVIENG